MTILAPKPFHGSYLSTDVQFLLTTVQMEMTPVDEKEHLIQSGQKHYSDMLSQEPAPSSAHLELFGRALDLGAARMAKEVLSLAKGLVSHIGNTPVILVSLVRAGVPLGVMLQRAMTDMGLESHHYAISIIRDRGIDTKALDYIEAKHGTGGIVFVDGWTGKGAITNQLVESLKGRTGYPNIPRLAVLADPAGCAWLAASDDDWLIPFGIMGAPVSGMVSRSVWTESGFHGCMECGHLKEFECSTMLVDTIDHIRKKLCEEDVPVAAPFSSQNNNQRKISLQVIDQLAAKYGITNINRIKPGIAEATRAVLRRVPDHVLVKSKDDKDVELLVYLAEQRGIYIEEVGEALGQYRAVTIIKKVA
ncbi:cysteine protease StiP family protein [Pantoea sp. JV6]|uniref:cysteine protease StiP family protein n=1 Tax=Pantoea sp. JV6 TaxID=2981604 RepID=UPI0022205A1C|nr:cysteine protease StiP family protein [Pantoea sp. JV6]MCW0973849.1 cysteine protease StiP family protein [Pantoea sp. JV6]